MSTETMIAVIVAIAAIAVAARALTQRQKTRKLKDRFGPEYDRVIDGEKDPRHAEAVLVERQKRVEKYNIRPLTRDECDLFASRWRVVQEHFVDEPRESVRQADSLITEAMRTRGYPMSDFDQRAADLSVDHPQVVQTTAPPMTSLSAMRESRLQRKICGKQCNTIAVCSSTCSILAFCNIIRRKRMAQELLTKEDNITTADLLKRSGNTDGLPTSGTMGSREALFPANDSENFRTAGTIFKSPSWMSLVSR